MPEYICNKYADNKGRHEVHVTTCSYLPEPQNRVPVGNFADCQSAIAHLVSKYAGQNFRFDGCYYCANPCHKG